MTADHRNSFSGNADLGERKQADNSLRENEELFRSIMELSPDIISIIGSDGSLIYNSPAAFRIHGYSQEEMIGQNTLELIHPDDLDLVNRTFLQVIANPEEPVTVRYRYRNRDGSYQKMECRANNHLANPLIKGIIAISRDIGGLELALQESEARYRAFVENSSDVIFILDGSGVFRFVSPSWEQHFGYPAAAVLGKPFAPVVHPDDVQPCFVFLTMVMTNGLPGTSPRYRVKCADGSWKPFIANGSRFVDAHGETLFHGIGRDLSAQEQLLETLRASEERYRRFIATANEGIAMVDKDFNLIYVNDHMAKMLGYQPEELIGSHVTKLFAPEHMNLHREKLQELLQGKSGRSELWHLRKDGSRAWLLTSTTPILGNDGTFQGAFAMLTDLSDRREAEIALQKSRDKLEKRVAERTAALARANEQIKRMSFELVKTEERERRRIAAELHDQVGQSLLLAKMKLDMLTSELSSAAESDRAGEISALLESSLRDIRSLLFAMRPPLLDSAGLKAALERLCVSLRNDYQLQVAFTCRCRSLPFATEERYSLYQAVRELLLNVVKHAGTNSAELTIADKGDSIVIRVVDRGAGFECAEQADRQDAGSGFGLFNVRQRIEYMGGGCSVASTPGQGTVVTLTVPLPENARED